MSYKRCTEADFPKVRAQLLAEGNQFVHANVATPGYVTIAYRAR